jgi:hypothetical protein
MADDRGAPIAYAVLAQGTAVLASDGTEVGTVARVLADDATGIFDGIVIDTPDGERFIDAPEVGALYERAAVLTIDAGQARRLPEPTANPAVLEATPDDIAGDTRGDEARGAARRVWNRLSGKS